MTTNYNQLCVWPGTIVGKDKISDFHKFIKDEFNSRIKYSEEVKTNPDVDENGIDIPETGGRNDIFFYIHDNDMMKFSVPRLKLGIRWWEDIILNKSHLIYSEEILKKYPFTWKMMN